MEVGSLHYDLNIDDTKLKGQLASSDKAVKDLGDNVNSTSEKMQAGFRQTAKVLAVVGVGLTVFAKSATDFTVDLVKQSKSLGREVGITTTEASRLVAAFGRMGVGADAAQQMFGIFSKKIQAATDATDANRLAADRLKIDIDKTQQSIAKVTDEIARNGDKSGELHLKLRELNNTLEAQQISLDQSADAFMKLGISTTDASGRQKDFNTILFEVADRFKAMPDGVTKTALALDLFGRSGKDMIKVLNLGSSGIRELEKEADRLGLTLNPNTIVAVEKLVTSQKNLKQQTDALKIAVGTATAPVLTEFNTKINELLQSLMNADGPMKTITTDVLAFGGPVLTASAAILTFSASMLQGVAAAQEMNLSITGMAAAGGPFALIGVAAAAAGAAIIITSNQTKSAWDNAGMAAVNGASSMDAAYKKIEASALSQSDKVRLLNQIADQSNTQSASTFHYVWNYATTGVRNLFDSMVSGIWGALSRLPGIIWGAVQNSLNNIWGFYGGFVDAGWGLITAFANGIRSAFGRAIQAVRDGLGAVRRLLPFSDAKEGPLSDLTLSGRRFSQTFAAGIKAGAGQIHSAVSSVLSTPAYAMAGALSGDLTLNGMVGSTPSIGGNTSTRYGDTVVNIGEIHNQQDENLVLRRLDRNSQLESMGISPAAGA